MTKFVRFELVGYDRTAVFGKNQENRKINHGHLQKIKRQTLESLEGMPAVTVNLLTNNIIDGQHRTEAFRQLVEAGLLPADSKLKVMFVETPPDEEKQAIIDANTHSKNWSLDDYIASYARAGIESYVVLDDWCKHHSLTNDNGNSKFRYGASIITGKKCSAILKSGEFTFTEEELTRAEEIHAEMSVIIELFNMRGKGCWIENLATSWTAVRNQHNFKVWLREMKNKKNKFMKLPKDNVKDWDNIFAQTHLAIDKKQSA